LQDAIESEITVLQAEKDSREVGREGVVAQDEIGRKEVA